MPVPYMGSKGASARRIVHLMKAYEPEATEIYDVFCGGFAISEEAIKQGFKVYSSDLDKRVIALLKEVLYGDCIDETTGRSIFDKPRFISREDFAIESQREDWFGGYVQTIWSFGNSGRSHMFGKEVEPAKLAGHKLAVENIITDDMLKILPKNICEKIRKLPDWHTRRIAISRAVKTCIKKRFGELEQLQQLQQLEQLERLQQLEQLQQLERLQQLQQLQQLERLSYDEVDIKPGAIIYCDPPYFQTAEYKESAFDHQKFYDWCREKSKTNPVFVSEYRCPDDFDCIYQFSRRETLSSANNNTIEKVFYLRRQDGTK